MATINKRKSSYFVYFRYRKKRRQISVGKDQALATLLRAVVDRLVELDGDPVSTKLQSQIEMFPDSICQSLSKIFGNKSVTASSQPIEKFCMALAERMTNSNTNRNYKMTIGYLVAYFGAERCMGSILPSEADAFVHHLQNKVSGSTANREIKRTKQFFATAARDSQKTSPFEHVKCSASVNKDRIAYVEKETAESVLKHLDVQDRLVFALARFAGFRLMSEPLELKWSNVKWGDDKIIVFSPKDKRLRGVPISKQLLPHLRDAYEHAEEGGPDSAITKYGSGSRHSSLEDWRNNARSSFYKRVKTICIQQNIKLWPRLLHSLRASWINDLESLGIRPTAISDWVGNTEAVRINHYSKVNDQDFESFRSLDC